MAKLEFVQAQLKSSRNPLKDINPQNVSAGVVSSLLAATGPPVIILEAASNANFTNEQTIFWMFSVYFFGGLYGIFMPLAYRIPIVGAHSITGVAFLATVASEFTYSQLIGSYISSSIIIFLIGIMGLFSKLMKLIPKEIIAAMMAGIIASYVIKLIGSIQELPLIAGTSLLVFIIFSKWNVRIPPVIASVFVGFILLMLTQDLNVASMNLSYTLPQLQTPSFSLLSILTVSIPLALLILSNDAAPGIGALEQKDFKPPINRIITFSGLFSILASFFGGQSANVAGMMSAICSNEDAGVKEKRYIGAVVSGLLILLFGIFAWYIVPFIQTLPGAFVSMLAGLALFGVLSSSLNLSYSKPYMNLSVTLTFVIAFSNITIFYISSPVWALICGAIIAHFFEKPKD